MLIRTTTQIIGVPEEKRRKTGPEPILKPSLYSLIWMDNYLNGRKV